MPIFRLPILVVSCVILAVASSAKGQANLPVYTDTLVNSFQDWSYSCIHNITNTAPVHTGSYSISVTITASGGALSMHSSTFNTSPYANVSFWINGGPSGGQLLKVYAMLNGSSQTAYSLPKLGTNAWQQFTVSLAALGVANKANFNGLLIQDALGAPQPAFYVDDVQIGAAPAPALVHLNVDATQLLRKADARWFGINMATWDGYLNNATTASLLKQAGILTTRLPGGSGSDWYHWAANASQNAVFYQNATNLGANGQTFVTVNYGSGTSSEAAGWVNDANIIHHCNFKYWEIGNESYGSWEGDNNTNNGYVAHDPYTYAVRAADYMQMMRAVDPTIKIGVVAAPGDSSYINNRNHSAYNPRTHATVYGWTPVMLATLKSLGAQPDFLIHHVYPQYTSAPSPPNPSPDSDPLLLQNNNWAGDAATLRQEISDYWGAGGTNIELCCTENNSDSSLGGKQLSSLVNGLYLADTLSRLMQTEFNSYLWWDLRNGTGNGGDLDPSLYGWRNYGDEGIITGLNGLNPTYYSMKLMQFFVRPGDTVLNASSDYLLLSAYASYRSDGALNLLVINKDSISNFSGQIILSNFSPGTNAAVHSYGIPQDNAVRDSLLAQLQDVIVTNNPAASNSFAYTFPPYSMTVITLFPTNYLTLALQMPANVDWNTITNWSDGNPASVSAAANPASAYDVLAGATLRSPAVGPVSFPGNQLFIDGDGTWVSGGSATIGEFRLKTSQITVPWLKMNGGQLNVSVEANSQSTLNGRLDILANAPFYNDSANDQGITINAYLTGNGNIEWRDPGFALVHAKTLNITCNTNTYTGTWNVIQGTLLGSGTNALGTNTITVGASAYLETTYDIFSTNATLTLNGKLLLHQNDTFKSVVAGGTLLAAGTYSFAQLNAAYPAYFPASWTLQTGSSVATGSGTLTVLGTPPFITQQPGPASRTLFAGQSAQFSITATGLPLQYQWRAGSTGSGAFTNLANAGNVVGATNVTLMLTNLTLWNTADYDVVLTNAPGAVTSSVASLTVVDPSAEAYQVAALAQAPVAYFPLNEKNNLAAGNAVAYDFAGGFNGVYGTAVQNGYNGIVGPRLGADGLAGFANTNFAAKFTTNLANAQITLPALNLNANSVTIAAWLKPVAPQNNAAGIIFSRAGSTVAGLCYTSTQANGDYTLGYNWNNESGAYSWNSGLVAPSGRWSLVVLSISPTYATIYVVNTNGTALATHTYTHVIQKFDGVTLIGDDSFDGGNGSRGFNGSIDEVEIFNKTLSQNQVLNLFAAAFAPVSNFTAAPASGWAPLGVNFTDYSTGIITNRHWIFGDGATLDTVATSAGHTYAGSGSYTATLVVSGPGGAGTNVNSIVANAVATPQITTVVTSQNSLTILGQGTPAASYGLLSYTNLLALSNGWPFASGTFDAILGTSTNQIIINPTNSAVFFRLKSPYP